MFRDILSSRAILTGFVFFLLIVSGSLLYSWHVRRTTEAESQRSDRLSQRLEKQNKTRTAKTVKVPKNTETPSFVDTHDETEALPHETETPDIADAFLPDDMVSEGEQVSEDVPVSPFGFGPYPKVPVDYFGVPIWNQDPDILSDFPNEAAKNIELIDRVLVKLWQQGDRLIVGGSTHNGKIYPHYDYVIYVEWEESVLPNGDPYLSVSSILTGAEEGPTVEDIITGNIPPNFTIIDFDDAGFAPYRFLNLKNKGY